MHGSKYRFQVPVPVSGGVNRFSDRRISQKQLFGFRMCRIFYTDFPILLIQRIADLSNILSRIVDLACNLVRILDCDFIVELLADSNLDKPLSDRGFCSKFGRIGGFVYPYSPPPPVSLYRCIALSLFSSTPIFSDCQISAFVTLQRCNLVLHCQKNSAKTHRNHSVPWIILVWL